jgi:NAD+ synthase (glutamine-hydrolysing)
MKCTILAIATLNQWSMDFEGNKNRIIESLRQSKTIHKAKLRIGPELEIPGYGCEDHFFETDTILHSWQVLGELLKFTSIEPYNDMLCVFGMPIILNAKNYNCAVCTLAGKIVLIKPKLILADDGNYRESRWFTPWEIGTKSMEVALPEFITEITGQKTATFGNFIMRTVDDVLIGSECCEELWAPLPSSTALFAQGVHIVFNASGSHFQPCKQEKREGLIESITLKSGGCYMYSNMNGCDGTRLYFDAGSMIIENGELRALTHDFMIRDVNVISACVDLEKIEPYRTPSHVPDLSNNPFFNFEFRIIDLANFQMTMNIRKVTHIPHPYIFTKEKELSHGPACWLWDYLRRSGAKGLFLPLSGGADSASTLAIVGIMCKQVIREIYDGDEYNRKVTENDLMRIVGKIPKTGKELMTEIMHTAYLATENSSEQTRVFARRIAEDVGSKHYEVRMDKIIAAFEKTFLAMSKGPRPKFQEQGGSWAEDMALQNIQARSRMIMSYLMGQLIPYTNKKPGHLLILASGNLEEGLTGYMTKYDCSSADVNLIGGISKVDLKKFMLWASEHYGYTTLYDISQAPPTAELKPLEHGKIHQTDEEDLGMTYAEMAEMGKLRRVEHRGPVFMFKKLVCHWKNLSSQEVAGKVKKFFTLHGKNRHKMNVITPSVHVENYSADDKRFDIRPMLYDYKWKFQFDMIDELLRVNI